MSTAGLEYLFICAVVGLITALVARRKGSSFWMWFLIGGVLPGLGLTGALLQRSEREELRRACPACGRVVKIYDAICTKCGTELEFPDVAIASESMARQQAAAQRGQASRS